MHGVRRAEAQLGDTACVIGLGLVGQLVVRLLIASGVRVVGLDVVEDRCRLAEKAGAQLCAAPTDEGLDAVEQALAEITGGRGADHVLLAAGGSSNGPVEAAARLARDRARVVDIGKTRLDLPWNAYYDKELDVRFSRSYGPGRYDDRYELDGIDYPAGYVRWTERRNLECFLDLIARKEIEVESLVSGVFPLEQATTVYADLASGSLDAVGIAARVSRPRPRTASRPRSASWSRAAARPRRAERASSSWRSGSSGPATTPPRCCCPHLARLEDVQLAHVATTSSLSAVNAQRRFGFTTASTTADAVLERRVAGRDLHRDPPPHPCRPGLPRPADREGRLRREAARADQRRAPADHRHRSEHRQRPAHGGVQPAIRAAAGRDEVTVRPAGGRLGGPLPGQRRTAGRRQLVPQRGAGRVALRRRRRPLHRHAELVGGQPARARSTPCQARSRTTCRPPCGSGTARPARSRYVTGRQPPLPEGDAGRGRRRPERPARQLPQGDGLGRAAPRRPCDRAAARTRASGTSSSSSSRPAGPARRCRSRSIPWWPPPRDDRGGAEPGRAVARSQCERVGTTSRLGWYAAAARPDVAGRGGLARPRPGRRRRPGRVGRYSRGQLAAAAPAAGGASAASPRVLPPDTAARVPDDARAAVLAAADRLLRGDWEVLGVARTDMVLPDWFL